MAVNKSTVIGPQVHNLNQAHDLSDIDKNDILGDIITAAILHLSGSAPPKLQFTSTDFNSYNTVKTGTIVGGDKCDGGRRMKVPTVLPGLGVTLNKEALKSPIFVIE